MVVPPPISVNCPHAIDVTRTFVSDPASKVRVWDTFWFGAPIETVVVVETAAAVALNVTLVKPAPMVMKRGIETLALEELSGICALDCAGLPRFKVHVVAPGVWIVAGEQTRLGALVDGVILRIAERTSVPAVAPMVALPAAFPATVAIKLIDIAPAGTVTDGGTVTWGLLLLSVTVRPPAPAGPLNETVQVLVPPAVTVPGLQATDDSADCGVTVSEKVTDVPFRLAVSSAEPDWPAVAVKFADIVPDWTTTVGGTAAETLLLLDSATVAPPVGAAAVRDTVHVLVALGATAPGLQLKLARPAAG